MEVYESLEGKKYFVVESKNDGGWVERERRGGALYTVHRVLWWHLRQVCCEPVLRLTMAVGVRRRAIHLALGRPARG